jgi:mono/diheme cytochrome c family protein
MLSNRARLIVKTMVLTLLGAGTIGAIGGLVVLRGGFYDLSAITQHYALVYTVLGEGMQYSVQNHARDVVVPPNLGTKEQLQRGAIVYQANCVQCHGGPGVAPSKHGMSMQPAPGPLVDADVNWKTRELYWITRNGIKMSGMPAWEYHLSEPDLWAVVAFVGAMPGMTSQDFKRMTAGGAVPPHVEQTATSRAQQGQEGQP